MISANRVFDPQSGNVFNEQGIQLHGRWIIYPGLLHPACVQKYYQLLSKKVIDFWGGGQTELGLGKDGYELRGDKGDGRKITLNLGTMVVFLNQHGEAGLMAEVEKLLTPKG